METPPSLAISSSEVRSSVASCETYQPIHVSLIDEANLWSQFSKLGTEMVINKTGRQMFPGVKLKFENLNPYKFYKVYMELAPVDGMRYRFDRNSWAPRGTIETSITSSWVEHPQSPAEGYKWMLKPVDFSLRLTNCLEKNDGEFVCLRSMYKYMLIIHVEEGSDMTHRNPQLTRTFPLIKTTFIAVTTYQNPQVKELKTETNIHAKGIRQKKLKQYQEMYHSVKENLGKRNIPETERLKRLRTESDFSPSTIQRLFSTSDESSVGKISPPSSFLPNLNDYFSKPPEFMNRNDPFTTPVLPKYRRIETSTLSERIPLTTPLTVHCPSPYPTLEHPSYYTPLLLPMHPQNIPIIPPFSSPNFYPSKWPVYQGNCICNICRSAALNICPSCSNGLQNCISCANSRGLQIFDHAIPSSSTDAVVSSSFENSASFQPTSPRNSGATASSVSNKNAPDHSGAADDISSSVTEALSHVYN